MQIYDKIQEVLLDVSTETFDIRVGVRSPDQTNETVSEERYEIEQEGKIYDKIQEGVFDVLNETFEIRVGVRSSD